MGDGWCWSLPVLDILKSRGARLIVLLFAVKGKQQVVPGISSTTFGVQADKSNGNCQSVLVIFFFCLIHLIWLIMHDVERREYISTMV